jgi:hypothetical protein
MAEHERHHNANRCGTFFSNGHGIIRPRSPRRPAPSKVTRDGKWPNTGVVKNISDLAGSSETGAIHPAAAGESGF